MAGMLGERQEQLRCPFKLELDRGSTLGPHHLMFVTDA